MKNKKSIIDGINLFRLKKFEDRRGIFFEIYNQSKCDDDLSKVNFVQENFSRSRNNVLRGLHFCKYNPQAQLVTVIKGKIFDVVVDLRVNSKTFGKYCSFELSDKDVSQIYMDKGFAHGFYVISDYVDMHYKVSQIYNPEDDFGIIWNDSSLSIDWPCKDPIISEKDLSFPQFTDIEFVN